MKRAAIFNGLIAAAVLAVGTAAFTPIAWSKEFRLAVITPPSHVWTKVANRVAERLPVASDGALSAKVFPAGQLGTEQEVYQQMSIGLVDAGLMTAAITSLRAPSVSGWFTPYLFEDVKAAAKATELPAAKEMLAELEQAGLKGLGYTFAGMRHVLMAQTAIHQPQDLVSQKIRIVPFPAMKTWWQAVDAAPTPVNLPEVYQALQTGLLDGVDIDLDALVGLNYQEVGKHLTLTGHMVFPSVMVMSQQTWTGLTAKEQGVFQDVVDEALAWGTEQQIAAEHKNLDRLKGQIEINEISDGKTLFEAANNAVLASFSENQIIQNFHTQVLGAE